MLAWFAVCLAYYALSFGAGDIYPDSLYISVLVSGAIELPCYVAIGWGMQRFGRRLPIALCLIFGGGCCCACALPAFSSESARIHCHARERVRPAHLLSRVEPRTGATARATASRRD